MPTAQDHKRAYDGDKGPNTGGMGAYAPVPHCYRAWLTQQWRPLSSRLSKDDQRRSPVSWCPLRWSYLDSRWPLKVIEFNARFGDPETQIILPRLTSDFAQNITDILDSKEPNITWTDRGVTLGVVVASKAIR